MTRDILANSIITLISFVLSYAIYVYVLQPSTYFSRSRLGLSLIIWVILFFVLRIRTKHFSIVQLFAKRSLWGIVGIFLLMNLLVAGNIFHIPYTYVLLPSQTVRINPVNTDKLIKLISYNTELVEGISLENFYFYIGWETVKDGIALQPNQNKELIWQGQPGQYVELRFLTCPNCGKVNIFWNSLEVEEIDLSSSSGGDSITIRHDYPTLGIHKLINLIVLEASTFIAAAIFSFIGISNFQNIPYKDKQTIGQEAPFNKNIPIIGLTALTIVVYGLKIQPILFNDDWCIIFELHFDLLEPFMERRPLHAIIPWFFMQVLPLHRMVYAVYFTQVLILLVTSALIYILINQLLENKAWFAFLVASLFLVFPMDYTRLYFTMSGVRLSFLLLVIGMILFVDFIKSGRLFTCMVIMLLLITSLLMYEGQLGLAIAWPLLVVSMFRRNLSSKKFIGIAGYYLQIGTFILWKMIFQSKIVSDGKLGYLSLPPGEIINRYFNALHIILGGLRFPFQDRSWISFGNVLIMLLIALCLVGIYFIVLYLFNHQSPERDIDRTLKTNFYIFLIGFGLWIAGYFPIILNFPPNIYGQLSRVNLFSIPGSVLILLSILNSIFLSMSRNDGVATRLTLSVGLMLILIGSIIQLQTQEAYNKSWAESKTFYQALFNEIPDLKNNTQIVLFLDGYQNSGKLFRPLFSSSWEAWCAFGILYDKPDLIVNYQYEQINVPTFPSVNVLTGTLEKEYITAIQDPGKLLVIEYNKWTNSLTIQKDAAYLLSGISSEKYSPHDQVLPLDKSIQAREMVK
ncbi:MAG TPA: hypothetical protein VI451_07095 [Anaerolineales bacterium]|nr:hypothetical protein [Anaerolineales bacterium]